MGEAQLAIREDEFRQQSSAAAFYLGRAWLDLRNDSAQAIVSFRRAIALEPAFLWAHNSLAHALFREQLYGEALEVLEQAEAQPYAPRLFMDTWSVRSCDVPLMLSKSLYFHYVAGGVERERIRAHRLWPRRAELLRRAQDACAFATTKVHDVQALLRYWEQGKETKKR